MVKLSATLVNAFLIAAPAFVAPAAQAADMVTASEADFVVEAPPPIPVFSWGGAYAGLQAGYGVGRDRAAIAGGPAGTRAVLGSSPDGIIGGGHLGALLSTRGLTALGPLGGLRDAGVVGLEGDVDGTDYHGKGFAPGTGSGLASTAIRSGVRGSIRARFGVAAQRMLFYGTGGIAFADLQTSDARAGTAPEGFAHSRAGYTLGGGVEWALMNELSLRAEYRYSDFGHFADPVATGGGPGVVPVVRRDASQRLQTGLSYRLGGPAS